MSFNARLGSTNFHRRRPFDRPQRAPPRPSEDTQPNELLAKQKNTVAPPAVRASAPPRKPWKDAARRGAVHQPHPFSRGNSSERHAIRSSGEPHPPSGGPSSFGGIPVPSFADVKRPWTSATTTSRSASNTERISQSTPFPPDPPVNPASLDTERPLSRTNQRDVHPLPARQAGSLDAHGPSFSKQKRPRKRRKTSSQITANAPSPVRSDMSQRPIRSTQSTEDRDAIQLRPANSLGAPIVGTEVTLPPNPNLSQVHARASDLLLNDLAMPARQTEVPPGKRRKLTPTRVPLVSGPTELPRNSQHDTFPASISSQVASEMGSGSSVKRERSPSPVLNAGARLVTQGCVRVAPLPSSCWKTHSGYQAARQQLAKAEMDKLRKLGLQPLRVFTREDGMVIDWKSDVPVLSDTLCPPIPGQQDRPGVDVHEEAMVQDYLFPARIPFGQGAGPVPPPTVVQDTGCRDVQMAGDQRAPQLTSREPSGDEMRANSRLVPRSSILTDVIDLTKEDDVPIVPELPSADVPHPSSVNQTPATYSDTGERNALILSQAALTNSDGSRATPDFMSALSHNHSSRVPLPRTVSISSDNSDLDEMEAAALDFLKRYMIAFSEDRAILARAYSRMATLSIIAHSDPGGISSSNHAPHQGRADIVSALLALPDEQPLYDEVGEGIAEVDWDLIHVEDTNDVLLICYATHDRAAVPGSGLNDRRKGKGRADRWAYEQRFLLRLREWDVEDR
ncbi:hypothetical protein L226DRAFT_521908 [Lentinus tigrinus ALCF2SS1-7]|uniref:NTF2 domain-containing protein n=1 Tax=Lentinus tigrinus ALCF2SS1-6 TaxID=1328759 RepID=A0A5C2SRL9_9APHY|nr:hypothetical protein L227DRAFT_560826 [Lentinus tigrinus ALCF2SS1-6]RPD76228.1 hypothetical protein L226DRAFT_521908 [Lentinus tigrinus ALCF2SS1-7]